MYDEKLNNAALSILKWAPFAMMVFGFWIMGNEQIFDNDVNPIQFSNSVITTDHNLSSIDVSPALPLFILIFVFFIALFFNDTF